MLEIGHGTVAPSDSGSAGEPEQLLRDRYWFAVSPGRPERLAADYVEAHLERWTAALLE